MFLVGFGDLLKSILQWRIRLFQVFTSRLISDSSLDTYFTSLFHA